MDVQLHGKLQGWLSSRCASRCSSTHAVMCAVVAVSSPTSRAGRYSATQLTTRVAAILSPSGFLQSTEEDGDALVGLVLERTPFYAEQGGQVADTGRITSTSGALMDVQDTQVGPATSSSVRTLATNARQHHLLESELGHDLSPQLHLRT